LLFTPYLPLSLTKATSFASSFTTVESLWQANMDLLDDKELDLYNIKKDWKIYSEDTLGKPQLIGKDASVKNSLVTQGCVVNGEVEGSVLFNNVNVGEGAKVIDSVLMPSLFEPCGLSQMMSLRYGTIPIVRETGGLKDSVQPFNEFDGTGTGFSFANYNAHEMMDTIDYALHIYYDDKDQWNGLIYRAMTEKLDWDRSADEYLRVFGSLLG
jgi:hypothetical protein